MLLLPNVWVAELSACFYRGSEVRSLLRIHIFVVNKRIIQFHLLKPIGLNNTEAKWASVTADSPPLFTIYHRSRSSLSLPGDSLIRGRFFIEPVPDYGKLGFFIYFLKQNSLIIPIKKSNIII